MEMVEMKVQDSGEEILFYRFQNVREASEMFMYLRSFFPEGTFIIQPVRH